MAVNAIVELDALGKEVTAAVAVCVGAQPFCRARDKISEQFFSWGVGGHLL